MTTETKTNYIEDRMQSRELMIGMQAFYEAFAPVNYHNPALRKIAGGSATLTAYERFVYHEGDDNGQWKPAVFDVRVTDETGERYTFRFDGLTELYQWIKNNMD
jgi:hypothetical protein